MFNKKDKIIAELLKDNEINSDKIKALTMATNLQGQVRWHCQYPLKIQVPNPRLILNLDLALYLKNWIWALITGMI